MELTDIFIRERDFVLNQSAEILDQLLFYAEIRMVRNVKGPRGSHEWVFNRGTKFLDDNFVKTNEGHNFKYLGRRFDGKSYSSEELLNILSRAIDEKVDKESLMAWFEKNK